MSSLTFEGEKFLLDKLKTSRRTGRIALSKLFSGLIFCRNVTLSELNKRFQLVKVVQILLMFQGCFNHNIGCCRGQMSSKFHILCSLILTATCVKASSSTIGVNPFPNKRVCKRQFQI